MRRTAWPLRAAAFAMAVSLVPAAGGAGASAPATTGAAADVREGSSPASGRRAFPRLETTRAVTGLTQPWDVQPVPGHGLLVGERETAGLLLVAGGTATPVDYPHGQVWVRGETGLMGLAVDPRFTANRRFYACHGGFAGGGRRDVRVTAWRLDDDGATAERLRVLLRGIDATSGRHGGCRLLVARNGALLVGTGDAAVGRLPQNRRSLAGKVLRLNRWTGAPARDNPWPGAASRKRRYLLTYGHRNVQGLAQRGDGTLWSVEHGPDRNDEVNRLAVGGNYGWDPRPGYDESVPMTDHSLPGPQRRARWRSGFPTLAASGATFVRGSKWGSYRGTLAVAALKSQRLVFMKLDRRGRLRWTRTPAPTRELGRLRSVTRAPNNDLLVTTANGADDAVVRVSPRP